MWASADSNVKEGAQSPRQAQNTWWVGALCRTASPVTTNPPCVHHCPLFYNTNTDSRVKMPRPQRKSADRTITSRERANVLGIWVGGGSEMSKGAPKLTSADDLDISAPTPALRVFPLH